MPLTYLQRIAETPAPTFAEGARADLMTHDWEELGFPCQRDGVGNVITRIAPPGTEQKPALLLLAHLLQPKRQRPPRTRQPLLQPLRPAPP